MNDSGVLDTKGDVGVGSLKEVAKRRLYLIIKRVFDVLISIILIILLSPLFLLVGICIRLEDGKAPILKQKRIGKNGRIFKLYKFRSMVKNADKILESMLKDKKYKEEWDRNQKFENDPRITKVGKIIRKTSVDELPQLFNVLKGDMSLIGPRPLVPGELDSHNGNHQIYESMSPGITGWWACNGRSDTTYEERLDLEYYYIRNSSILLDIKCFFKTISVIIIRKGAK